MRLTQTTVGVLCYMKLLLIFQNNINDKTIKKIEIFMIWNYILFDIIIWLYQIIIESFVLRHPKTQFLFLGKPVKYISVNTHFHFFIKVGLLDDGIFSSSQCVCNNFFQDICFLIDFLLEINKMIFVLYPLEIGQLLLENSKKLIIFRSEIFSNILSPNETYYNISY